MKLGNPNLKEFFQDHFHKQKSNVVGTTVAWNVALHLMIPHEKELHLLTPLHQVNHLSSSLLIHRIDSTSRYRLGTLQTLLDLSKRCTWLLQSHGMHFAVASRLSLLRDYGYQYVDRRHLHHHHLYWSTELSEPPYQSDVRKKQRKKSIRMARDNLLLYCL